MTPAVISARPDPRARSRPQPARAAAAGAARWTTKFRSELSLPGATRLSSLRELRWVHRSAERVPQAAMIDLILAIKFVHLLAAAAMFGTWLGIAGFMLLAYRSGNPSVVALVAQFVVRIELFVVAAALALQPISGFPLAWAIGLTPLNEFWIDVALVLYVVVVAAWLVSLRIEIRLRNMAREAALGRGTLAADYPRLFRIWFALAAIILAAMVVLILLMVWQPRLD